MSSTSMQRQLGSALTSVNRLPPSDIILSCMLEAEGMTHSFLSGFASFAVQSLEAVRMSDRGSCSSSAKFVRDKQQSSSEMMRVNMYDVFAIDFGAGLRAPAKVQSPTLQGERGVSLSLSLSLSLERKWLRYQTCIYECRVPVGSRRLRRRELL